MTTCRDPLDATISTATSPTPTEDVREMLATIGVDSIDRLFDTDPGRRQARPRCSTSPAPGRRSRRGAGSASSRAQNKSAADHVSFLGGGAYAHYQPACIDQLLLARRVPHRVHAVPARSLAGDAAVDLRVPDAPVPADRPRRRQRLALRRLDRALRGGAARRARRRRTSTKVVIAKSVHPQYSETRPHVRAEPRHRDRGSPLDERRPRRHRRRCAQPARSDVFAVAMQSPNFLGVIEDYDAVVDVADGRRRGEDRRRRRGDVARHPHAARRARLRHLRRRRAGLGHPARSTAARTSASWS